MKKSHNYIIREYLKYLYLFITQFPIHKTLFLKLQVQKYHERLQAEVENKKRNIYLLI